MGSKNNKTQRVVEKLHHFSCLECKKWWTVSGALVQKTKWFCPWCGSEQLYKNPRPRKSV